MTDHRLILAERRFCTETVTAETHLEHGRDTFSVHIEGGQHHGVVIHCSTRRSALWLFDRVVHARVNHVEWNWLAPAESL